MACRLWPVRLYHFVPHYLTNSLIFRKRLLNMKCCHGLFKKSVWNISLSENSARYSTILNVQHYTECTVLHWMCSTILNVQHYTECTALYWMYSTILNAQHYSECTALYWMHSTIVNVQHYTECTALYWMHSTIVNVQHYTECTILYWMHSTHIGLHVQCRYSHQTVMKLEFSWHIFENRSNITILKKIKHWEPSSSMRTGGRTDRHLKSNIRFSQFMERAWKKRGPPTADLPIQGISRTKTRTSSLMWYAHLVKRLGWNKRTPPHPPPHVIWRRWSVGRRQA